MFVDRLLEAADVVHPVQRPLQIAGGLLLVLLGIVERRRCGATGLALGWLAADRSCVASFMGFSAASLTSFFTSRAISFRSCDGDLFSSSRCSIASTLPATCFACDAAVAC